LPIQKAEAKPNDKILSVCYRWTASLTQLTKIIRRH